MGDRTTHLKSSSLLNKPLHLLPGSIPSSSASSSSPSSPPSRQQPINHAVTVNNMYLETKTNMLEVIEEGLQLKLEIQNIREQFLSLIDNFGAFDKKEMKPPLTVPSMTAAPTASPSRKPLSSARARVKALYAARKARIMAKRAAYQGQSADPMPSECKQQRQATKMDFADEEEDKENVCRPPPPAAARLASGRQLATSTPTAGGKVSYQTQLDFVYQRSNCGRKFLTPIKEENQNKRHSRGGPTRTQHKQSPAVKPRQQKPAAFDVEGGEYVTLKSPKGSKPGEFVILAAPSVAIPSNNYKCPGQSGAGLWNTSPNENTSRSDAAMEITSQNSPQGVTSPRNLNISPVKYASSDTISELYTSKVLKDVSQISRISRTSLREQISSGNLSGAFHSTFNYPLHSTLNYPLSSTFNIDSDSSPKAANPDNDVRSGSDARTTISEPSSVMRARSKKPMQLSVAKSLDDTAMDYSSTKRQHKKERSGRSSRSSRSSSSSVKTASSVDLKQFSPSSFKTPSKKPQAQLCKEHGLHPTFGGPCIFQNDDTLTNLDSSSSLDGEENNNKPGSSLTHVTETDCDSSYLSECVDDAPFGQGFSEAEEYTATYDSRNARMRMLKRQTGQINIQQVKPLVGLSESDLFFDVTNKNFSINATRASLPDLSGLSTMMRSSQGENHRSGSKLQVSTRKSQQASSSTDHHTSPNSTLRAGDQRPLSVSTTTDESPESNTGLTVPVNSPNITDSGGSSSRPTTDTYDYVDIPVPKIAKLQPDGHLQMPLQPGKLMYVSSSQTSSSSNHHQSKANGPSQVAGQPQNGCHHPYKRRVVTAKPALSTARTVASHDSKRSRRECDSGCSTHSSKWTSRTAPGRHITISDNTGVQRTVVQHSAVTSNLPHNRKKALVKKLKQFSNNFYKATSTGNLQIKTLGHF